VLRAALSGSDYVGVFARATDDVLLVRPDIDESLLSDFEAELEVPSVQTTIAGSGTVGALVAGNENGLLVTERVRDRERDGIVTQVDVSVGTLPGRINAAGNVILANDAGAYVHHELSDEAVETIRSTLDVPVERGTIAGVPTVGTAAAATNNGVLCHPKTADAELDHLQGVSMTDAQIDTFLTEQGTGVLALAASDEAYAVPVSFGYADGRCYFAFFRFTDEPTKAAYAEATETACLAVYEVESAFRWKSVLAFGPLESVGPDRWDEVGAAIGENAWSPDLSTIGPRQGSVDTYVMPVETVTGRLGMEHT
jgi:translation initiation factor 6